MATNEESQFKKKVYLHIGHLKTGTTAIQNCLFENRQFLLKNNIHYVKTGLVSESSIGFRHYLLSKDILANHNSNQCLWAKVTKEIEQSSAGKFVISYEGLIRLSPAEISVVFQALSQFDVRVVCYLRDQVRFLQSLHLEYIQNHGLTAQFRQFEGSFNWQGRYYDLLTQWQVQFGKQNMMVADFSHIVASKLDVVEHFFETIGADDLFTEVGKASTKSNPSLTPWSGYAAALNNKGKGTLIQKRHFARTEAIDFFETKNTKAKPQLFSKQASLALQAKFASQNQLLMANFGVGDWFEPNRFDGHDNSNALVYSLSKFNLWAFKKVQSSAWLKPLFVKWLRIQNWLKTTLLPKSKAQIQIDGYPITSSETIYWLNKINSLSSQHDKATTSSPTPKYDCLVDTRDVPVGILKKFLLSAYSTLRHAQRIVVLSDDADKPKVEMIRAAFDNYELSPTFVNKTCPMPQIQLGTTLLLSSWDIVEPNLIEYLTSLSVTEPQKMVSYFDFVDWHDTLYSNKAFDNSTRLVAVNHLWLQQSQLTIEQLFDECESNQHCAQLHMQPQNQSSILVKNKQPLMHIRLNKHSS